ncbi:16S rRNA (guanine(966)-N(2))-methyltransferase RsmD [Mycoplasmatota bacterium WC44]
MKVIAGEFKRRNLHTLKGMNTRPTTARNKENIFNVIGPYFDGGVSLDMFGGSGSLTIESISRGIEKGVIIDNHHEAIKVIKMNVEMLKIEDRVQVIKNDYMSGMNLLAQEGIQFDLILIDPPFSMLVVDEIIEFIDKNNMLKDDGIIMAEYFKDNKFDQEFENIYCYRFLDYGTSHIKLYTKGDNK